MVSMSCCDTQAQELQTKMNERKELKETLLTQERETRRTSLAYRVCASILSYPILSYHIISDQHLFDNLNNLDPVFYRSEIFCRICMVIII